MRRFCLALITTLGLSSCSTFESLRSPSSDYRDHVEDSLMTKILYDSARENVVIKVLRGDQKLKTLQEGLSPGFGFDKKEEVYQLIVAMNLAHPGGFSKSDIKILLNDFPPTLVKEISGAPLLETLYFYAYPYQRVFVVDFPKEVEAMPHKTLRVRTPRGEVSLNFEDEGNKVTSE